MPLINLIQGFVIALSAVFLMEIGDKTQLTAFALSIRYRSPLKVLIGVVTGLSGVTLIAVIIGIIVKDNIDVELLKPLIGVLFILGGLIFLISQLRNKKDGIISICPIDLNLCEKTHENCPEIDQCEIYLKEVTQKGAFINSMTLMFLAELGDKTMLMGAGLATQFDPLGVFIGAILALTFVNAIGVFAGEQVAKKIPKSRIEILSGLLFVLIGIVILIL
ncbi:MAG: TMEM165/GDT1 family protein [Promethearchaeota archaeon]